MKNFKLKLLTLALLIGGLSGTMFSGVVLAGTVNTAAPATYASSVTTFFAVDSKTAACEALQQLDSTKKCDGTDTSVDTLVKSIVSILSYVVGIIAVIMAIIGGFKYVTSSGDPSNVTSAKNTLLYALVGIFIVALAQFLVHFVLQTAANT